MINTTYYCDKCGKEITDFNCMKNTLPTMNSLTPNMFCDSDMKDFIENHIGKERHIKNMQSKSINVPYDGAIQNWLSK